MVGDVAESLLEEVVKEQLEDVTPAVVQPIVSSPINLDEPWLLGPAGMVPRPTSLS